MNNKKSNRVRKNKHEQKQERISPRSSYSKIKIKTRDVEKKKIAQHVVKKYIKDFDAVLLDAGSTAELIAEEMFSQKKYLSVLTNNMGAYFSYILACEELTASKNNTENIPNNGNELLISGGRYVDSYESLLGEGARSIISDFTPNVIIIGTSGLTDGGIFCHGSEESDVKHLLWTKPANILIVATDWTKIGKTDAKSFGEFSELNAKKTLIVTSTPTKKDHEEYQDKVKEFDNQLKKIESNKYGIKVERI